VDEVTPGLMVEANVAGVSVAVIENFDVEARVCLCCDETGGAVYLLTGYFFGGLSGAVLS
jgi:hypothetical protein